MKLTDTVNRAITERFAEHKPRSFEAKVRLVMTCDAISPYPSHSEARSLLSQRNARARRAKRQRQKQLERQEEDARTKPVRLPYVDN